jgi:protease IV
MDRNRKIILSILMLVVVACVLAVIDISLKMKSADRQEINLSMPDFGPGVGIVKVYGAITISDSVFGGGSDDIVKKLSSLEKNSKIKAIVLRINSPGGTIASVQEIFEKLMELRKKNIVLVASMGDMAASGGYYIASACNFIIANYGTTTGSIGVIASSPNLKGLFEKLGIKMNVIKSGKYKDILSPNRDLTADEKALLQEMIDSFYMKFLKDVSLGRNVPISEIQPYADGRVMTGETALKYKFIDAIGTYEDAVRKAKNMARLPENAPVYDQTGSFMELLLTSMENKFGNKTLESSLKKKNFSMIEYSIEP